MAVTAEEQDTAGLTRQQIEERQFQADGREAFAHEKTYWVIALILGVITAVEVSTYTHEDTWGSLAMPALLVMMAAKFFIVTWWFMHLKNDTKLLTGVFYFCLVLAAAVYVAFLASSHFFA